MKYLTNSGLSYFLNKIKAYIASQLNSKASAIHTHTKSDIIDLPNGYVVDSTLDGTSSNAIANSAVVDALDGKSDTGHTHTKSEITDFPTLATVATSGSYNDLSNKPTTMTPKSHTHGNITNTGAVGTTANKPLITTTNGVITTGSFGTTANTFCQGNDSRLSDARTPTSHTHSASDITSGLATVATSGSYNDLSNKPTIPTVNNATLTIQKNGTTVKTFTANASSNVTANITVPTKTSDLTNDSGFLTSHQDLSGYVPLSGTNALAGSIVPNADNAYEFGSSSYSFSKIYTRYVQGSSTPKELSLFSSSNKYEPWNHGAFLSLFAEDYSTDSTRTGTFMLQAKDSGNNCRFLIGYPNGTLTWGSKNVAMQEDVVPRSGGAVLSGQEYKRTVDNGTLNVYGGMGYGHGAFLQLTGKDEIGGGDFNIQAHDGTNNTVLKGKANGTLTWGSKNVAMYEDVVPRSGGAVITGKVFARTNTTTYTAICGGTAAFTNGGEIDVYGTDSAANPGCVVMRSYPTGNTIYFDSVGFWCINELQLGKSDRQWGQIYSTNSTISTSDARLKNSVKDIDDKLLDAWGNIEPKQYKFNDATEKKGEKARFHTGYLAQDIQAECEKQGVNASDYGLFCYDEWEEQEEESEEIETEKDGKKVKEKRVIQPKREKGDRYSLRYEEALVVECKYLRRENSRLKEKLSGIEERLEKLEKAEK